MSPLDDFLKTALRARLIPYVLELPIPCKEERIVSVLLSTLLAWCLCLNSKHRFD